MTGFSVTNFGGIFPVQDPIKLSGGAAQSAIDCDLQASDLRMFSLPKEIARVVSVEFVNRSGFAFNETQMFVFNADSDATYGPVRAEDDLDNRVFISNGFKEFPVYATKRSGLPNGDAVYHGPPVNWIKLGVIPGPVTPTATVPAALNGVGMLAAGSPTVLVLDGNSPLSYTPSPGDVITTGSRIRISMAENEGWNRVNNQVYLVERAEPGDYGHLNYITLRGLNTQDLKVEGDDDGSILLDPDAVGPFQITYSDNVNWQQEYETSEIEDRFYVYTLVTALGEEGPPSLPSDLVSVGDGQSVQLITPTVITDPGRYYTHKRIYRTVPMSTGEARYYFVAEIEISQELFEDDLEHIELGEELQSLDWYPPPEELKGLVVLPNGVMAGFVDRTLYLSEPYQPHAWPLAYTKNMDNPIVGIAAFGQQLVVATKENPYIGTASDPLSMTFAKLDTVEPCISKRAMRSTGDGVIYPSPNGLILTTPAGSRNVLNDVWDEKEWRDLFKSYSDSFAVVHDQKYYLTFFNESTRVSKTYIFDPSSQTLEISSLSPASVSGMIVDRDEDRLYLLAYRNELPLGPVVNEWNPDEEPENMVAVWKSRIFVMPYELSMGAMQVFYDLNWPIPDGYISITFIVEGITRYTVILSENRLEYIIGGQSTIIDNAITSDPIRLPGDFLGAQWELLVATNTPVQSIFIAEAIEEVRGAMTQ